MMLVLEELVIQRYDTKPKTHSHSAKRSSVPRDFVPIDGVHVQS